MELLYLTVRKGKVHRSVEISEGECYYDLDKYGHLLGIEILCSGQLEITAEAA